jgi:hypothetical protein
VISLTTRLKIVNIIVLTECVHDCPITEYVTTSGPYYWNYGTGWILSRRSSS